MTDVLSHSRDSLPFGSSSSPFVRERPSTMDNLNIFRRFSSKKSSKNSHVPSPPRTSFPQSPIAMARNNRDHTNPFAMPTPTRRPQSTTANESIGAPPPYSPASSNTVPFSPADLSNAMQVGDDSPYAFLRTFDTLFLIDDSGSMAGRSWRETSAAIAAIAPICTAHDADGLDIYFLNHRNPQTTHGGYTHVTTTGAVQALFQNVRPLGGTPTGTRLNQILKPYLAEVADSLERAAHGHESTLKPLNIIVITDGVPSDDVESVIVNAARKLDSMSAEPWQVGIQFFQVGREPEAAENLRELDDALSGEYHIRDMVDTVPWSGQEDEGLTAQGLLKVCLGSVVRRHDRRSL